MLESENHRDAGSTTRRAPSALLKMVWFAYRKLKAIWGERPRDTIIASSQRVARMRARFYIAARL
jgi:hypothetical protein